MKIKLLVVVLCFSFSTYAQVELDEKNLNRLIEIAEVYSKNNNFSGKEFKTKAEALRAEKFNPIIDIMVAINKGKKDILSDKYLKRPSEEIMYYWYVIHQIHYNNIEEDETKKRPTLEVAKDFLSREIDSRLLLDSYYSVLQMGISFLFNDKNLSRYDFDLDSYGLKDETEKAILYLTIVEACGVRFYVLHALNKPDKLLEFERKMPKINGQLYYKYTDFDYEDFDLQQDSNDDTFNERHLNTLFNILFSHFTALANEKKYKEAGKVYYESILFQPKYFQYSESEDDLEEIYDDMNKG